MASSVQRHMPRRRSGHTTAVTIGAERLYLTANQRDDGSLGEIFIQWGKHGTSTAGLVSVYAIALSTGLAHRVPLAELIRPGLGQYFTPNGRTDDPEIPRVCSAVDYIARRLAVDWLPYSERAALGVFTLTERVRRWELGAGFAAAPALPRSGSAHRGRPGQQPGAHHLDHLARRGGEVQPHGRQLRVSLVRGQHGRGRLRMRP
jgi:hypothetical protein